MRRGLGVLLIACALVLAIGGSGAFSSATLDRGTTVSVADDPNAYVGVDVEDCTITNNAGQSLEVALDSEYGHSQDASLDPGQSVAVAVSGETTIRAEGSGISAELVRTFDCTDPLAGTAGVQDPEGNASLLLDLEADRPITVTAVAVDAAGHEPADGSSEVRLTTNQSTSTATLSAFDGASTDVDSDADIDGSFQLEIKNFDGGLDVENDLVDQNGADITVTVSFEDGEQQVLGIEEA